MNKRKTSPLTSSKTKMIKFASVNVDTSSYIANEWNRLGDAFRLPTTSSACIEDVDINEFSNDEEVDDEQNTMEIESINESFYLPSSEGSEINIEDVNDNTLHNAEVSFDNFHQSPNNLHNLITSPMSSPLKPNPLPRGSDWLKDLPELSAEDLSKVNRKPQKKRNFVKGGFAEQLERQLAEQQSKASTTDLRIKLKIKDVSIEDGLHLMQCLVIEATEFNSISIEEECVLVIRSSTVQDFTLNNKSILTVQPPWQLSKTKDEKLTYLISPVICNCEQDEELPSKSNSE